MQMICVRKIKFASPVIIPNHKGWKKTATFKIPVCNFSWYCLNFSIKEVRRIADFINRDKALAQNENLHLNMKGLYHKRRKKYNWVNVFATDVVSHPKLSNLYSRKKSFIQTDKTTLSLGSSPTCSYGVRDRVGERTWEPGWLTTLKKLRLCFLVSITALWSVEVSESSISQKNLLRSSSIHIINFL